MQDLSARTVFFVKDAERSLSFYTGALGFALDWTHQEQGRALVFQVSLFGFQLLGRSIHVRGKGWPIPGCAHDPIRDLVLIRSPFFCLRRALA